MDVEYVKERLKRRGRKTPYPKDAIYYNSVAYEGQIPTSKECGLAGDDLWRKI